MKRSQIVLFSIVLIVTGLIYAVLMNNKKDEEKKSASKKEQTYVPIAEVKNTLRSLSMVSYGQITPNVEINVSFEVQGKLNRGVKQLKAGSSFRRGQILYSVANDEALFAFRSQRAALAQLVLSLMPDVELDYPSEASKWIEFIADLNKHTKRLPEFPKFSNVQEQMFMTNRGIETQYFNLRSTEVRLDKYIFVAPFSGTVVSTMLEPGSIVSPGMQIARIVKTGDLEIMVPISIDVLETYKDQSTAKFTDADGNTVGHGKIVRVSDVINAQTQSADVYYSIMANEGVKIYHGMYVNVSIEKSSTKTSTAAIPRSAYNRGYVHVLKGKNLSKREVVTVSSSADSLYVTGLKNGEQLVLESVEIEKGAEYEGVRR